MRWYAIFFFCFSSLLSAQNFDYEPFFTARITDNSRTEFFFSNLIFRDLNDEVKYFFWIRRGSDLGTASYQVDFKKIRSIVFTGEYEERHFEEEANALPLEDRQDQVLSSYTPADLTLTSGETFPVLINTAGSVGGMDRDLGVYGQIYMNYNIISSIEFLHWGEYQECPFCGAHFYGTEEVCPFDKTPLIPQNP